MLIGCRREAMFLRTQRNLPCIMPFEGGFISCYTALCVSSIRALRRFFNLFFIGGAFAFFRCGHRRLHGVDVPYPLERSAFTVKYALQVTWVIILPRRFIGHTCMTRSEAALYLHREVSVFIYARKGQDTFTATIFLFSVMPKKKEYCLVNPCRLTCRWH